MKKTGAACRNLLTLRGGSSHELQADNEDHEHAEAIRLLRMVKSRHPVKPLFEGGWA